MDDQNKTVLDDESIARIIKDMENEEFDPIIDKGVEISFSQCGVTHSVKRDDSDVTIFQVRYMLVSLLRGAGFSDNLINRIIKDEEE